MLHKHYCKLILLKILIGNAIGSKQNLQCSEFSDYKFILVIRNQFSYQDKVIVLDNLSTEKISYN